MTMIPLLVVFSIFAGIIGAFCTAWFAGIMNARPGIWYPVQFRGMVCVVQFHQVVVLCFHHRQRFGFLWIYSRRRFHSSG